jgi:hypothetical protein
LQTLPAESAPCRVGHDPPRIKYVAVSASTLYG